MGESNQEEKSKDKSGDLKFEALMEAVRAEGVRRRKLRRRKHQLLFIHLSVALVTVVVGYGLLQRSIEKAFEKAFAPITLVEKIGEKKVSKGGGVRGSKSIGRGASFF